MAADDPAAAARDFMRQLDQQLRTEPERTRGLEGTFELVIDGHAGGTWWIEAADGTAAVHEGAPPQQATVTVRMPHEVFVGLGTKEIDGAEAYMDGLLTVEGDQSKVMYLAQLFGE